MRRRGAVLAATMALAGCGGSGNLSAFEQSALLDHVAAAREAARSGDVAGIERALSELRERVRRLRSSGDLGENSAAALLAAIASTREAAARDEPPVAPEPAQPDGAPLLVPGAGAADEAGEDDEAGEEDEAGEVDEGDPKEAEKEAREAEKEAEKEAEREAREREKELEQAEKEDD